MDGVQHRHDVIHGCAGLNVVNRAKHETTARAVTLPAGLKPGTFFVSHGTGLLGAVIRHATESWAGHAGPQIGRGANLHPRVFELLREVADAENMSYSIAVPGKRTGTDADAIHMAREGVPCGLVSIPLRYMHSPVETMQLADVEGAIELIASFCLRLGRDEDFRR